MSNSSQHTVLQELNQSGTPENIWSLTAKNTFKLGRGTASDVVLPYSWVSRQHSIVQQDGSEIFQIMDLGSSNGTYLNGKRIYSPTILHNNDIITLGKTSIRFVQLHESKDFADKKCESTLDMTVAYIQKEIVTILVCDIHDFTSLSEKKGNKTVSKLLQFWTKKVGSIVHEHDGLVDKFIGDAVMATWIGGTVELGIRNALRAALDINNATKNITENIPDMETELSIGAAINTGEAMMGNMGVASHRDSTVIGDVVNVAFRLESMTVKDDSDIIIGAATALHLEHPEKYFTEKSFDLKGKKEKINAYACSFEELRYFMTSTVSSL